MKIILCVDNEYGMMFNNRRQSRDRVVIEDIINNICNKLWIRQYSKSLFVEYCENNQINYSDENNIIKLDINRKNIEIIIDDDMLYKDKNIDCYYVENIELKEFNEHIDTVIMYMWNKKYPADMYLDIDISKYRIVNQSEISGYSHDIITKIVYEKI